MKPNERDELLGRLDERTSNTWRLVEKIDKRTLETDKRSIRNSTWVNTFKWTIGLLVTGVIAGITKLVDWW